jgi:hypothetical protein
VTRRAGSGFALAFFALVAVVFAFPLAPSRLATHVAGNQGDALLNLWILDWVGTHVDDGWRRLWDTSIFWPHDNTLAYSESYLAVGVVHRALTVVVRSDVLALNVLYLAAWTLSGWLTFLLARRVTGSAAGALVAGLVYTVAVPRLSHHGFLQTAFGCLVPLVLLLVVRLVEAPGVRAGAALGAAAALLALSSSYYGLMTLVALAVVVPVLAVWRPASPRALVRAVASAAVVGAVLVAPVAWQHDRLQDDPAFRRDPEPSASARLADFLRVTPGHYVFAHAGPLEHRSRPEAATIEQRLYPGAVAAALGAVGAVALVRRRRELLAGRAAATKALVAVLAAGVVLLALSFGEEAVLAGRTWHVPWAGVWDLPGFDGIRAPARFVAFGLLALALLAALGVEALLDERARRTRVAVVAALLVMIGVESAQAIEFVRVPDDAASEAVNDALDHLPAGPVVELPIRGRDDGAAWPYVEMPRQYLSLADGHPRVNGYSGFEPPGFGAVVRDLNTFPGIAARMRIRELGVRYVVLRLSIPGDLTGAAADALGDDQVGTYTEAEAEAVVDSLPEGFDDLGRHGDAFLVGVTGR